MTDSEDASVRTVVVAVAVNLLVAVAKGVAAVLTGSAAMLAETTHSIADTADEVLLYVGVRRGLRPADDRHPLGYGKARYFWSLLAAVGSFVIGGLLAIADGIQSLRQPEPLTNVGVGVAVLVVSAGLEGLSWRTAHRQLRTEASARHRGQRPSPRPGRVCGRLLGSNPDHGVPGGFGRPGGAGPGPGGVGAAPGDRVGGLGRGGQLVDRAAADRGRLRVHAPQRRLVDGRGGPGRGPRAAAAGGCRRAMGGRGGRADRGLHRPRQLLVLAHVVPVAGADLPAGVGRLRRRLLTVPAVAAVEITPVERR